MNKFSKLQLYGFATLTGILLALAWPVAGFTPLLFIAFVPLLLVENECTKYPQVYGRWFTFRGAFLAFLIWNAYTSYWIYNATPMIIGGFMLEAGLFALAFQAYHWSHKKLFQGKPAYWILCLYWIGLEFFNHDWDLSWPFLSLGNGFSTTHQWVQWYEYTGIFGGSLWILAANALAFLLLDTFLFDRKNIRKIIRHAVTLTLVVALPLIYSLYRYHHYEEKADPVEIVVVQPNLDPYSEQYDMNPQDATLKMLDLALQKITPNTCLVVTPESMIQEYLWEDQIPFSASVQLIQSFLSRYPQTAFACGLSSRMMLPSNAPKTGAERKYPFGEELFYEAHNTALLITQHEAFQKYYKSKLTPGVEAMPFVKYMKSFEKLAIDLGGTIGTLGISKDRTIFHLPDNRLNFAPIICYEAIYGEFVAGFVKNGAEILCIMTNDGWWGDTPGHRQLASYGKLRAIETRHSIARSANTGISCFINQRGDVEQATNYWVEDVIRTSLNKNDGITWYVKYGDVIGRVCYYMSFLLLLLTIVYRWRRKQ